MTEAGDPSTWRDYPHGTAFDKYLGIEVARAGQGPEDDDDQFDYTDGDLDRLLVEMGHTRHSVDRQIDDVLVSFEAERQAAIRRHPAGKAQRIEKSLLDHMIDKILQPIPDEDKAILMGEPEPDDEAAELDELLAKYAHSDESAAQWRAYLLGDTTPKATEQRVYYIAGPMTGYPEWNHPAFYNMAARLRCAGHRVVCPAELHDASDEIAWDWYLRRDLAELVKCTHMLLLPGWERSKGARLEHTVAEALGLGITYPHETEELFT
ncbi:hydrolase [Mycobacterium phage Aminay]|uniref:Hydrolase n=1 Tax=Mycobacterium phage Aminay TaxID=2250291 RepID=A0A345KV42_9CAUD|nr:hydrolase [Mycobacterium phage Aminay]AXH46894.1 hydrolase [Mycobacterium phage Aminay]